MSKKVQVRRDTLTNADNATPDEGELMFVTSDNSLRIGDGITQGGKKLSGHGYHQVPIPAASFKSHSSVAVDAVTLEYDNEYAVDAKGFNSSVLGEMTFTLPAPWSWDANSNAIVELEFTASSGTSTIAFYAQMMASEPGQALNTAFGTKTNLHTVVGTANTHMRTARSSVAIAGASTASMLVLKVGRAAASTVDDHAVRADVINVNLWIKANKVVDE